MKKIEFNGWENNVYLSNGEVELVITADVGPRVIRFGFIGEANLFAEIPGQQGGKGESEWMIRGGHRFWVAPEAKPWSYELDNVPVQIDEIEGGVRTCQPAGPITGISKQMEIRLSSEENRVEVVHTLKNEGSSPVDAAPWALSVMGIGGQVIIPLPEKIAHTDRLTHNQSWSIWGYTDFSDSRWTLGSRFLLLRQDASKGPAKLGLAHREGWVAYQREGFLFVKEFAREESSQYPDEGCNFETFTNEEFLEVESLGPLVTLNPGESTTHTESWMLHRDVPRCATEDDVVRDVLPLVNAQA